MSEDNTLSFLNREMSMAGIAVITADLIRTALILMEDGSSMSPEEIDALVGETQSRARRTVEEIREALVNGPG